MATEQIPHSGSGLETEFSQFDLLLAAIPLALLAGIVSTIFLSVPPFVGITLGGALGGTLVGYSMYAIARIQSTPTESPLGGRTGRIE